MEGQGREEDGGKMRGVNREGLSERERETGGAQFAITGATGQKVSKKEDEFVSMCVCEGKMVTECLCICVCV